MSRPTRRQIEEADQQQLRRQANFRLAADYVAAELRQFDEITSVALFGSVAQPLAREVPRFDPFRRHGVEVLHECKDVDLAIWITRPGRLHAIGRARAKATQRLFAEQGVGVAHHEVDLFLFAPATNAYLGRVCAFNECPKGREDCAAPGCGREPFLKQHEGFTLYPDALADGRCVRLWGRE